MINYVVKRDGTKESFDADKLNQWIEWACSGLFEVSWSDVVIRAIKSGYEGMSTEELQKCLIDSCVALTDYNTDYEKVAARLYLADLRKKVFNKFEPPKFHVFYQKMVDAGLWEDMGYDAIQLSAIENRIDHNRDSLFPYSGLRQMGDKYLMRNKINGTLYETPQFLYMGLAMASMNGEPMEDILDFYDAMSLHKVNVPTPPLIGCRTNTKGFASCCLISGGDTADSIEAAGHIVYQMVKNRSGIGIELETRGPNEPVKDGLVQHNGKLNYYRMIDALTKANTQESRGGSATMQFAFFDPEIETLLRLRNPKTADESRIDQMDYSFAVNKYFWAAFIQDKKIALISPYYAPKTHKAFYGKSIKTFMDAYKEEVDKWKDQKVIRMQDGTMVSPVKWIESSELVEIFAEQRSDTARIYMNNIDEVNRRSTYKDPVRQSNLCFTGDTMVAVADGRNAVSIKQLAEESQSKIEFPVYSAHEVSNCNVRTGWKTDIKNAVAFKTGTSEVILVKLSNGDYFECTLHHELALFGGGWVEAKDAEGKQLADFYTTKGDSKKYRHINSTTNGHSKQHIMIHEHEVGATPAGYNIDHIDDDNGDYISNLQVLSVEEHQEKTKITQRGEGNAVHKIKDKASWLHNTKVRAFGDTNGNHSGLSDIVLIESGIEIIRLNKPINCHEFCKLMEEKHKKFPKSFSKNRFNGKHSNLFKICKGEMEYSAPVCPTMIIKPNEEKIDNATYVEYVSTTGKYEDVYDLHVQDNHNFYILTNGSDDYMESRGVLVHNCLEIVEPTTPYEHITDLYSTDGTNPIFGHDVNGEAALCNLGGVVINRIDNDEEYERISYLLLKFVDNIIEMQTYPFPHMEFTSKARRNAGIGMINLAHAMAENGLKYDSQEGRTFMHYEAERMSFFLHKASIRLAQEKGACEWFHKTTYSDGVLPIDNYTKFVDEYHDAETQYDWEMIRKLIAKYGMRNSVLEAYMPSESSSVTIGCTNGVEPIRQLSILKSSRTGDVPQLAPDLDLLRFEYQLAFDIKATEYIKGMAVIQKWCGQSISANVYYNLNHFKNREIPLSLISSDLMLATKLGLKTLYYHNTEVSVTEECENCSI